MTSDSDSDFTAVRLESNSQHSPGTKKHRAWNYESQELREIKALLRDGATFFLKVSAPVVPLAAQRFVLPPPGQEELEWLAIFLCLVSSSTVLIYRDQIGYAFDARVSWLRQAPLLGFFLAVVGTLATVSYVHRQPAQDFVQAALYVLLWPAYSIPLTLILVYLEQKRTSSKRIEPLLGQLAPVCREASHALEDVAGFLSMSRGNAAWRKFGIQILDQTRDAFHNVKHGRIEMDVVHMPHAFKNLADHYGRFDAISVREIPFWGPRGDWFAQAYSRACAELPCNGKIATRIFVVSREEFEQFPELIAQTLFDHICNGFGVAVVPYEELPDALRQLGDNELDFALWDLEQAWSSFRQNEGAVNRKILISFSARELARKLNIYETILQHAWLVDRRFQQGHQATLQKLLPGIRQRNAQLCRRIENKIVPDGGFLIEIGNGEKEVKEKVAKLITLWNLTRPREGIAPQIAAETKRKHELLPKQSIDR